MTIFEDASSAYERGDYEAAIRLFLPMAVAGDERAVFNLALAYAASQDNAEAAKWWKKAAEAGIAQAQAILAGMYLSGKDIAQDYALAESWYRKAAEQGIAQAQSVLSCMYYEGRGIPQDFDEAAKWGIMAAEQGDPGGQLLLSAMYEFGMGVKPDNVQAHMWANLAAKGFPAADADNREEAIRSRDEVATKMTAAQIIKAQDLAREWKPK